MVVFFLRRPAVVEFVVFQVSPGCRRVGRFRVVGRAGVNRVRFRGRLGRRLIGPGTYRLRARSVPGGRTVVDTRLVVVRRANREEIALARGANTCPASRSDTSGRGSAGGAAGTGSSGGSYAVAAADTSKSHRAKPQRRGVLGARFTKAVDAVKGVPFWLFVLLGFAIALLAVAALPTRAAPNGKTAAVLARHRATIALAGAAAFVVVTVAYALL
jgi:hypothetical protein